MHNKHVDASGVEKLRKRGDERPFFCLKKSMKASKNYFYLNIKKESEQLLSACESIDVKIYNYVMNMVFLSFIEVV